MVTLVCKVVLFSICTQPRSSLQKQLGFFQARIAKRKGVRVEDIDKKSDMMDHVQVVKVDAHYVAGTESTWYTCGINSPFIFRLAGTF